MLHSYSFMVSGLFIPIIVGIFVKRKSNKGAFWSMIAGGSSTLILIISQVKLPFELDANIYGISISAIIYLFYHYEDESTPKSKK